MTRLTPWIASAVLLWVIAITVRVEETRLARERAHTGAALLAASNAGAARDSTREVALANARVARLLGDSLGLVEKRAQQVKQRADALDRALGRERVARFGAIAVVESLRQVAMAAVDSNAEGHGRAVRVANFSVRHAPYTIGAEVAVPAPPDSARIQLRIALDPIPIEARVSCARADPGGIRDATVSVSTPKWATVQLGTVEQSPEVCASPTLSVRKGRHSPVEFRRLMVGAGPAFASDGRWRWAILVGGGFVLPI